MNYDYEEFDGFFFDFDGVLTDNKVYLDQNGLESVVCCRADGLGFDILKKTSKLVWIFSTETNSVVIQRANKLNVKVINSIKNKAHALNELAERESIDLSRFVYVGNDVNDYYSMMLCGLKVCPSDAHDEIKKISDVILLTKGGNGVVREVLEKLFKIDFLEFIR